MNPIKALSTVAIFCFCLSDVQRTDPKKLSDFKKTDFVLTLEHPFSKNRNAIYCSSFLYAWNALPVNVKNAFKPDSSLIDLRLLMKSTSYLNTLKKEECIATSSLNNQSITVKSQFQKSLPFDREFISEYEHLLFDDTKVSSFQIYGFDCELARKRGMNIVDILYYENDNNFVVKLATEDKEHEIVLSMSDRSYRSMTEIISDIDTKRDIGEKERKNESTQSRYSFIEYDMIEIPKISFDISANFNTLENIRSNNKKYRISTANQRTAFNLNEKGAEIITEGEAEITFFEPPAEVEEVKPKKMLFNKPFFIMLKRIDNDNPYFASWVANTELLVH